MTVALDTNAYVDFLRGEPSRVAVIHEAERIRLPLHVFRELRAGFAAGRHEKENMATLHRFLASPRVSILHPDTKTGMHYSLILADLRKQDVAMPSNDVWIAALALQHGIPLCTSDPRFQKVTGLTLC